MTILRCCLLLLALGTTTSLLAQVCPPGIPRVAPNARYTVSEPVVGDFVVTDVQTGLMWKRCSEGLSGANCTTGSAVSILWSPALALANGSTHGGFSDWRMPNREELRSLVETGCYGPSINSSIFPGTMSDNYWTSTSYPTVLRQVWMVDFNLGGIFDSFKTNSRRVRLVRGGQWLERFSAEADSVPNAFSLTAQTGVPLNSERTSDPITVTGLTTVTGVGVSGAAGSSYSINGGTYRSEPGAVANSDVVRVRHTSAPAPGSGTTTILAIGGISAPFTSTTVDDLVFGSGFE